MRRSTIPTSARAADPGACGLTVADLVAALLKLPQDARVITEYYGPQGDLEIELIEAPKLVTMAWYRTEFSHAKGCPSFPLKLEDVRDDHRQERPAETFVLLPFGDGGLFVEEA